MTEPNMWDLFTEREIEQFAAARAIWVERETANAKQEGKILFSDESYLLCGPRVVATVVKIQMVAAGLPELAGRINPDNFHDGLGGSRLDHHREPTANRVSGPVTSNCTAAGAASGQVPHTCRA